MDTLQELNELLSAEASRVADLINAYCAKVPSCAIPEVPSLIPSPVICLLDIRYATKLEDILRSAFEILRDNVAWTGRRISKCEWVQIRDPQCHFPQGQFVATLA